MSPVVQPYGGRRVAPEPLPGVRLTAAETPESEGAGVDEAQAREGEAIAKTGLDIGTGAADYALQQKRQADVVASLNAQNQLTNAVQPLVDQALTKKGAEAIGVADSVGQQFDDAADQIAGTLTSRQQQDAFLRFRTIQKRDTQRQLLLHEDEQHSVLTAGTLSASLENAKNVGMANGDAPPIVAQQLANGVTAIRQVAPGLGAGPEETERQVTEFQSDFYVGVINQQLALGNPTKAQAWFDLAKDSIVGSGLVSTEQKLTAAQKAIDEGALRVQATKTADAIIAAGGTPAEQDAQIRALDNESGLRDAVQTRVDFQQARLEKQQKDLAETTLKTVYNTLDQTHNLSAIPPQVWTSLSGAERSAATEYTERLVKGTPVETDPGTYYALMQQASGVNADGSPNEKVRQDFAALNLMTYRTKLDNADFKQATDLQMSIRSGDRAAADAQSQPFRTNSEVITRSLEQYGIDTAAKQTAAQRQAIGELYRLVDRSVTDLEARPRAAGQKPIKISNEDVQDIVDKILAPGPSVPGSWWGLLGTGWFGGKKLTTAAGPSLFNTTIGDVPKADQDAIRAELGPGPVSDQTVLDWYLRRQMSK